MDQLIDPATLVGKRVFISTKKEWYIGTLKEVREWAIEIIDWVKIHGFSDLSMKITSYGGKGRTSKIIMHSGGSRELESIELNRYSGDPFVKEEEQGDIAVVKDASSFNGKNDDDLEIPNEVFDVLFPTDSGPAKEEDDPEIDDPEIVPEIVPKWLTETPKISDRSN